MKMRWLIGLVIGGIVSLIASIVLGFVCGLVGFLMERIYPDSHSSSSAYMLMLLVPFVLAGTHGPVLGALVGLVSGYLKSWRNVAFMAVLAGIAQSFLIFLNLFEPATLVWLTYTSLAVVSMLAAGLAAYYGVSYLQRSNIHTSSAE